MVLEKLFARALLFALVLTMGLITGCSDNSPFGPGANDRDGAARLNGATGDIDLYGRVAMVDPPTRRLFLQNDTTTIWVSDSAEIVSRLDGIETPIGLDEINADDSAEVRVTARSDGSWLADRIRIRLGDDNGGPETEISGRVAAIDPVARSISLANQSLMIVVAPNAQVVHKLSGEEVPIGLDDIVSGDSVDVRGVIQTDGSLLADRVRLREEEGFRADVEFTSVITAIDYAAGQLTVAARSEVILVDSMTYIFRKLEADDSGSRLAKRGDGGDDDPFLRQDLTLSDLMVGDTVEVHANRINAGTLRAVAIEVEDGAFENNLEVEFKDTLLTVDPAGRIVTFAGQSWNGLVEEGAQLTGLNGEPLALGDFLPGELVEVKGFKVDSHTLRIVRLSKDNN